MTTVYLNGVGASHGSPAFEEVSVTVPWGVICGKWWGSRDEQPVLALHGWQDNAGTFDTLAPLLCKDIPIFSIDLPGHGFSSPYPVGQYYYLFWDGIQVIRRIVKHFHWKKIKLLGHSLGGAIAFLYAASFPDEIDCYISIDIASPTVRDPVKMVSAIGDHVDKFLYYETLIEDKAPGYTRDDAAELVYKAYEDSVTKECCDILMKRGIKPMKNKKDLYQFTRDPRLKVPALGFMTLDQVMEFASRIICNVMNIRGDPGMTFHNPENYKKVLDKIEESAKKVVRIIVPGTHHLHLNNPERISNQVREFLLSN